MSRMATATVLFAIVATAPVAANDLVRKDYADAGDRWVTISDTAITSVSEIDVTWTNGAYRSIRAMVLGYLPTVLDANKNLYIMVRAGGSWVNGLTAYGVERLSQAGTTVAGISESTWAAPLEAGGHHSAGDHGHATIDVYPGPGVTSGEASIMSRARHSAPSGRRQDIVSTGVELGTATVDGLRFVWSDSGVFAAVGRIVVMGIKA